MANKYFKNSMLDDEQAETIISAYCYLDSPRVAAARANTTRQTTARLYLKLSKHIDEYLNSRTQDIHYEERMSALAEEAGEENPRLAVAKKLRSMVLTYSEDRYRNGTNYREYRAARRSGLNADKLDTWIVADEIRKSWGKISQKAFAAHWSLVEAITDQRVDSLAFFPSADVSEERVRQVAANSLYNDLKRSLALNPI